MRREARTGHDEKIRWTPDTERSGRGDEGEQEINSQRWEIEERRKKRGGARRRRGKRKKRGKMERREEEQLLSVSSLSSVSDGPIIYRHIIPSSTAARTMTTRRRTHTHTGVINPSICWVVFIHGSILHVRHRRTVTAG